MFMKKIILLCLIISIKVFAQSEYNIELKKIYCDWTSPAAFVDSVETIIRDNNGNIIQPSNDFYYEYHAITDNLVDPPTEDIFGGLGLNKTFEDNDQNFIQTWFVNVKDPANQIILGTSNTVEFRMETNPGKAKRINFQALRSNGSTETGVHQEHWMYVVNLWNNFNFNNYLYLTVNHDEVLRSSPGFLSANNDKFHYWNNDRSLVLNYNHFYYEDGITENLIARYNTSYGGVTVQYNFDGFSGDSIEFKDPWLVDYHDLPYGMRNRGMNAPFKKLPSPFNPSLGSQYKGVLLGQGLPNWAPPYYAINIPSSIYLPQTGKTHNLYLQSWDVSGATLQYPNSLTTPVAFTNSSGSTITANVKGTQFSNKEEGYLTSSQRKFVRTDNGNLHTVYESLGKAWYEISTDNGISWQIANNGQPLSGSSEAKLPAIDYTGNFVVIVWQEKDGGAYDIKAAKFSSGTKMYGANIFMDIDLPYSANTNPLVAIDGEGRILFMWKRDEDHVGNWPVGLVFSYGVLNSTVWSQFDFDAIPSTNANSINPTIVADKDYNLIPAEYHLAWEQPAGSYSYIKYFELYRDGYNNIQPRTSIPETPSDGAGFWTNGKPSIIVLNDHTPRLVWVGYTP
jgi:hypothetical protein